MKKTLLILAAISPFAVSAQITIVQADLPVANTQWINTQDTSYSGATSPGGANQAWNFASLQNHQQDTTIILSASGSPYAAQFPGSNLYTEQGNPPTYAYYTSGTTGWTTDGIIDPGSGTLIQFNPARLNVPVPFTYNDLLVHNSRFQIDTSISGTNYRFVSLTQQTFDGDGYGSLQLPNGNHPATLRIKETDLTVDSIYIGFGGFYIPLPGYTPTQSQTTNFTWYENGATPLLLSLAGDSLGLQINGGATYVVSVSPTGINEPAAIRMNNVYPNPSSSFITTDLSNLKGQAELLYIYDITGRQIDVMNVSNIDRNTFDVRKYENGRYLIRVTGDGMQPVTTSFTVVH